jgi:hypothetical protein
VGESLHTVFGIRHHGPGSARALKLALEELKPDCILIEGPADADDCIRWVADPEMKPPVSLLAYVTDNPNLASFYPLAEFSPEWQAMQFGVQQNLPVRFMDLPQCHSLALQQKHQEQVAAATVDPGPESDADEGADGAPDAGNATVDETEPDSEHRFRRDPLHWLAQAAGHEDSERWWDEMVESRLDGRDLFEAISHAMISLRAEIPESNLPRSEEILREAWMRRTIRTAIKEGFKRIAVVCGAWHLPALVTLPPAKQDDALLKNLPKAKISITWVPTTYGRLSMESGYGAGVEAPGWYDYLWGARQQQASPSDLAVGWLVRVGRALRSEDLDASSASVIETVRLAEALAALRGRPLPGLPEFSEATQSVLCMGLTTPLELIRRRLMIDDRMGQVPEGVGTVALEQDIQKTMKRLRMQRTADVKPLALDLRKETDLERSVFLHRLVLLGIPWGEIADTASGRGTFKEVWNLQWKPELILAVIEASLWGTTIEDAANSFVAHRMEESKTLPDLTALIGKVMLADLGQAIPRVLAMIATRSAVSGDVFEMMGALPPLAHLQRYGDVRQTSLPLIVPVILGLLDRVCVGLPAACASLDDDAAKAARSHVLAVSHDTIPLISDIDRQSAWNQVLLKLLDQQGIHGLVAGTCARLVLDGNLLPMEEFEKVMSRALSRGGDLAMAAAWIEGFLSHSGAVLVHDPKLFRLVDAWLMEQPDDAFVALLPVLRRTFSTFQSVERQRLMKQVRETGAPTATEAPNALGTPDVGSNSEIIQTALNVALTYLGLRPTVAGGGSPSHG